MLIWKIIYKFSIAAGLTNASAVCMFIVQETQTEFSYPKDEEMGAGHV